MTLSLNIFLPICSWTKHSPTGTSASLLVPEIFLLHFISLGLFFYMMDAPVS